MDAPQSIDRVEFKCPECKGDIVYDRKNVFGVIRKRKAKPASAPIAGTTLLRKR
jgi:hypothetical protein